MNYNEFILSKTHLEGNHGIKPLFIPDAMFDFQKHVSELLILKGRGAGFLDTGLGKTIVELVTAYNYVLHSNKPVLIITPLAVAFQFLKEAEKFGIDDVEYSRDGKFTKKIIICNYERLHYFNSIDFDCVVCDESSILKNFDGAIKNQINGFIKKVKYRYLFTATPSPNDYTELGTSSEALGYLGYMDMLGKFFKNNEDTVSPLNIGTKWRLKGHAAEGFFAWVSSWSISMRKPSDLGFSDQRHVLPELVTNFHSIRNEANQVINGQIQMFNKIARSQSEVQSEQRRTVRERCERAVELASAHDTSVYWCNLNPEGDLLQQLDRSAYQLKGSMKLEQKEEILLAFAAGEIKKLITKAKITAFGLNWQHCGHTTYFPTFSYEQWYQAIRRFWRFGRVGNVIADMVHSDGQKRVIDSLFAKTDKANTLFSMLNDSTNKTYNLTRKEFNQEIIKPTFLKTA